MNVVIGRRHFYWNNISCNNLADFFQNSSQTSLLLDRKLNGKAANCSATSLYTTSFSESVIIAVHCKSRAGLWIVWHFRVHGVFGEIAGCLYKTTMQAWRRFSFKPLVLENTDVGAFICFQAKCFHSMCSLLCKGFANVTAEKKQFITVKSHHQRTNIQINIIIFGEIRVFKFLIVATCVLVYWF